MLMTLGLGCIPHSYAVGFENVRRVGHNPIPWVQIFCHRAVVKERRVREILETNLLNDVHACYQEQKHLLFICTMYFSRGMRGFKVVRLFWSLVNTLFCKI